MKLFDLASRLLNHRRRLGEPDTTMFLPTYDQGQIGKYSLFDVHDESIPALDRIPALFVSKLIVPNLFSTPESADLIYQALTGERVQAMRESGHLPYLMEFICIGPDREQFSNMRVVLYDPDPVYDDAKLGLVKITTDEERKIIAEIVAKCTVRDLIDGKTEAAEITKFLNNFKSRPVGVRKVAPHGLTAE